MFKSKPIFIGSFNQLSQLPVTKLPEIAFVGRSNVGKSSLINTLTQTAGLAKTSSTPGRTQSLNFFNWDNRLMIVDLPGYGFAKAPRHLVLSWQTLMRDYLRGRPLLKRIFLLIDSRHGVKSTDEDMMKMLDECATTYQVVFTKSDKVGAKTIEENLKAFETLASKHPALFPKSLTTSSEKGFGMDDMKHILLTLI